MIRAKMLKEIHLTSYQVMVRLTEPQITDLLIIFTSL